MRPVVAGAGLGEMAQHVDQRAQVLELALELVDMGERDRAHLGVAAALIVP